MAMISSIITVVTPPIALVVGFLAMRNTSRRRLAILAILLSGVETLFLVLLFLSGR